MPEAYTLTVSDAAEQVRGGQLAPTEYVGALLDRIDTHEPDLQAWVTIDREAVLSDARQREQEPTRGIMAGVPVGLKDIFYTAGMKTTACSRIYADFVPEYDATCVTRLKETGAVILGKAVTTEFATSDPSPSRNPWNREHTPGGSSSGSSVAVASGMCPAALGSQTGGSTCRPAAYNGIVGLKPTYGRISRYGVVPVSWSLDTVGILVRTVTDAAILLQAMAGYDVNDPGSAEEPVPNFVDEMGRHSGAPRLGLLKTGYFFDRSTPEVRRYTEVVAAQLAQAGADYRRTGTSGQLCHRPRRSARHNERGMCRLPRKVLPPPRRRVWPQAAGQHRDGIAYPQRYLSASPASAPRVPSGFDRAGRTGGRAADAGHAGPGAQRSEHHRRRGLPGALDLRRVAHRCRSFRPVGVGATLGNPVGCHTLRGRAIAGRSALV